MKKEDIAFLVGISLISGFSIFNLLGLELENIAFLKSEVAMATSVNVTATVVTTVTCTTSITSSAFGTLSSASVASSTPDATSTMICANSGAGCVISVQDTGTSSGAISGLWAQASGAIIESPNSAFAASTTLAAGTEGFGILATTTASGTGATLTIGTRYNNTGNWDANIVGGASTTAQTLATANASTSREVSTRLKAAISASTLGGSYQDTIIFQCVAN